MTKYKIISTKKNLKDLIEYCKQTKYACIDFEAPLEYHNESNEPWILGVSFQPGSAWIIPLQHKDSQWKGKIWKKRFLHFCKEVILNKDIIKVSWNLKFEYKWFMRYGIIMRGILFDAMLAKYCLDEERPHGLKDFVENWFPKRARYQDKLAGGAKKGYDESIDNLSLYCATDCDLTLQSMIYLEGVLIKKGFYKLFRNLLMMCTRFLAESEFGGALIDELYLQQLIKDYKVKVQEADKVLRNNKFIRKYEKNKRIEVTDALIKKIKLEIKEIKKGNSVQKERMILNRREKIRLIMSGQFAHKKEGYKPFNFNSPAQLADLLYKSNFGFRWKVKDKTEAGNPSTAEATILKYKKVDKSGFIDQLLKYREVEHLNSTYVEGMYKKLDKYGRVHANFQPWGTVTGRLSCIEPNLQNIPRDTTSKDIKTMFVPPPGFLLGEVDYSQAELRMVAELAEDKALIDIFRRNYNVHVATACKMFANINDYDKIKGILKDPNHKEWLKWEKQKKKAKSLNFSILYLQGDEATAETLECSIKEARKFKKEWFRQFPQVEKWIDKQIRFAHKHGYVYSIFGRKRRLHDIDSPKPYLVAECERQSVNAPIQGGSGDFGLFSEVIFREKILSGEFPIDIHQVYRVHDSIGFYIRPRDIHKVIPKLVKICDNPETMKYFGFELKHVKMKVSPEVGINWASLEEYDPWKDYSKLIA